MNKFSKGDHVLVSYIWTFDNFRVSEAVIEAVSDSQIGGVSWYHVRFLEDGTRCTVPVDMITKCVEVDSNYADFEFDLVFE